MFNCKVYSCYAILTYPSANIHFTWWPMTRPRINRVFAPEEYFSECLRYLGCHNGTDGNRPGRAGSWPWTFFWSLPTRHPAWRYFSVERFESDRCLYSYRTTNHPKGVVIGHILFSASDDTRNRTFGIWRTFSRLPSRLHPARWGQFVR